MKRATALLRALPAEVAHDLTLRLMRAAGPILPRAQADDPRLAVHALGRTFPNPVGLAAGFDKNARVPAAMERLGFGFVECGTLTPRPQSGNPKPRLFRLDEDRAVINRMGFNNAGMEAVARRLERGAGGVILGLNIGANRDSDDRIADYVAAFLCLAPFAAYVTINVSSPNTPGLRGLQRRDALERLLAAVLDARVSSGSDAVPVLLKIAPDLDAHARDDIAAVLNAHPIAGLVVSNTTVARPASLKSAHRDEAGGLSGVPLFAPSTRLLKDMRMRLGPGPVLIGVGGIASGAHAYAKIRAGATLVQLYTALVFEGPGLITRIKRELVACVARDGLASVGEAIGRDCG